jgi:hypothetical protein
MTRHRYMTQTSRDTFSSLFPLDLGAGRVIVSRPVRDWRKEVTDTLNALTALERGWDGYRAGPVSFDTAHFALQMLESICRADAPAPQIVPGANGDLQIEWHTDNGDVELHVIGPYRVEAWRANRVTGPDGEELVLTNDFTEVANWIIETTEPFLAHSAAA